MHTCFARPIKLVETVLVVVAASALSATIASAQTAKVDPDQIVTNDTNGDPVRLCDTRRSHSAAIVGTDRDMVWVYTKPLGDYLAPALKDPLRDGKDLKCELDVHYGLSFIAVRYGEKRDLWAMYGIKVDGTVVVSKFDIRDGQQHDLIGSDAEFVGDNEFLVVYGTKRDRSMRFCFDGEIWTRSPGSRGATYPSGCHLAIQLY